MFIIIEKQLSQLKIQQLDEPVLACGHLKPHAGNEQRGCATVYLVQLPSPVVRICRKTPFNKLQVIDKLIFLE